MRLRKRALCRIRNAIFLTLEGRTKNCKLPQDPTNHRKTHIFVTSPFRNRQFKSFRNRRKVSAAYKCVMSRNLAIIETGYFAYCYMNMYVEYGKWFLFIFSLKLAYYIDMQCLI